MKKNTLLSLIIFCVILLGGHTSIASDKRPCLICHKYPGLIRVDPKNGTKLLHIDETRFLESLHGESDCRDCHSFTTEFPHTGVDDVSCTDRCHENNAAKIEDIDLTTNKIHQEETFSITEIQTKSTCHVCHSLQPHFANNHARAFLNMHSNHMICEVCHLKNDLTKTLTYDWNTPEAVEFDGKPYGNYIETKVDRYPKLNKKIPAIKKVVSWSKTLSSALEKSIYSLSRIAPYSIEDFNRTILMDTKNRQMAEVHKEKQMGLEQREKELAYFHEDVEELDYIQICANCHSKGDTVLDYQLLGLAEEKINRLQNIQIIKIITEYETFYFPELLHDHEDTDSFIPQRMVD